MSEVHRLPKVEQVEEEASLWIARMNADEVSAQDRARFEAWRTMHPLHARTYDALAVTWGRFAAAGPLVRAVSIGQSLNEAAQVRAPRRRWLLGAAAAASIVAVAAIGFLLKSTPDTLFQTAIGEHSTISLPDGSTLELNSASLARVEYSDRARVIRLERGEGFFKVAPDRSRPFWVAASNSWVRALGTSFNVYLRPSGVRVTVSEGKVMVGQGERLVGPVPSEEQSTQLPASILSAGQQVELRSGSAAIRSLPPVEINRSVAWRSGAVVFEKQALGDIVDELGRYTTLQLIVKDDSLRALWVGGTFEANSQGVEEFIKMLQDGLRLQIRRDAGKVYIERK